MWLLGELFDLILFNLFINTNINSLEMKKCEYIIGNNRGDGNIIQIGLSSDVGKHLSRHLFMKTLKITGQILGIYL